MAATLLYTLASIFALFHQVSAGQIVTNGLSIIDAPQTGSPGHAGSTMPIAVEVTGNGQISLDATNPSSNADTHFISLEIFLVSSTTQINITVASGPDFLTNETGSVRHLNFNIPTCIPAGDYNLTFYEAAMINKEFHFTIFPIAIPVQNDNPSGQDCTGLNQLQVQPQPDSSLPSTTTITGGGGGESSGSGFTADSNPTTSNTGADDMLTLTVTVGDSNPFEAPTSVVEVTRTIINTSPTTVVVVSLVPVTTTITQNQQTATSTFTETYTGTMVVMGNAEAGFLPVGDSDSGERNVPLSFKWIVYSFVTVVVLAIQ